MSKTIFILDDDPLINFIVEKMMSKVDSTLNFIKCADGKEGLKKFIEYQGNLSDCIILLDLNMPVLDGWEFLNEIQPPQFNDHHNIIVNILSSSTDKIDIEKASHYSIVKKFYHKPLSLDDIKEILNSNIFN